VLVEEAEEAEIMLTEETEEITTNKEIVKIKEVERTTAKMVVEQKLLPRSLQPKQVGLYLENFPKEDDHLSQKTLISCYLVTLNSSQMEILNQKATIMVAKMEMGMDEKININRHPTAKEKIITETKEIIVHQTTKGQSQLTMEVQIETKTIETTNGHQTTETNKIGITTSDKRRMEDHLTNNHLNVRIIVLRRSKIHTQFKKSKNRLQALELAQKLLLRLA